MKGMDPPAGSSQEEHGRAAKMMIVSMSMSILAAQGESDPQRKKFFIRQVLLIMEQEELSLRTVEIEVKGKGKALAMLDERNPHIAEAFWQALPLEARASLWGEEVYFDIPLEQEDENSSPTATAGDICYWSPGPAFCIFFGKTQPYSPVNHLGGVVEGLDLFAKVAAGDRIVLNRK